MSRAGGRPDRRPFRILVVCTANVCRSPAAEALLRQAFDDDRDDGDGNDDGIVVNSAGLHALVGQPVAPAMARLLPALLTGFAARQLTPARVQDADLVLTMTRDQRARVASVLPTAVRRTFTLREFADLAGLAVRLGLDRRVPGPPAQRLAALVAAAPRLRAARGVGERDDIEDPYGRDAGTFARVLTEISDAVDAVAGAVRGADRPAAGVPPGRGDEYVEDEVG